MIDLYYWTTPNGHKVTIFLEETGLPYNIMPVNIGKGEQFKAEFVAGDYSIADMAIYPWIVPHERQGQNIADFPHLKRWLETVRARPAVERAYEKAKAVNPNIGGIRTAEERAILFGQTAASVERAAAQAG